MVPSLAALLLLASPTGAAAPAKASASLKLEGAPPVQVRALAGAAEVVELCKRLVPAERLRPGGDPVDRGLARAGQETSREEALDGRYAVALRPAGLAFAPYDGPERRLEVAEPATLELGGGTTLYATQDRALPVAVDASVARRILAAQAAGRLGLRLTFDLPEDAVCSEDLRGKRHQLGVEPVEWTWLDGETALAWGGVAADRPAVNVTAGAQAAVEVGEPIAGPSGARGAVAARQADLARCYAEGLQGDPALDGVVVVDLGAKVAVAADSTGSPALARCVERALAPLAGAVAASVPIRFELTMPGAELATPAATGAGVQ